MSTLIIHSNLQHVSFETYCFWPSEPSVHIPLRQNETALYIVLCFFLVSRLKSVMIFIEYVHFILDFTTWKCDNKKRLHSLSQRIFKKRLFPSMIHQIRSLFSYTITIMTQVLTIQDPASNDVSLQISGSTAQTRPFILREFKIHQRSIKRSGM